MTGEQPPSASGGQTGSSSPPTGWALLHSKLPASAIKPLATSVYGVAGLSDVNEGYLVRRLFLSGLRWNWHILRQEYLGAEDRAVRDKDYTNRYYLAAVHGELILEGPNGERRTFHGSGASDNRKVDAAFKGAATVAFKNACKWAGLTAELFLEGKAIDDIHQARVTKDADSAPASVDALVQQAIEVYGDPAEKASEPPMALPPVTIPAAVDAAPKTNGADRSSSESEDRQPLYVLARSLKTPRTALDVDQKIDKQSHKAVLRELILAHGRDCGTNACEHVIQLAGLK